MVYGIIGVGSIAAAIVTGACEGAPDAPEFLLSPRNAALAAELASLHKTVRIAPDNQAVIDGASVLILCLRPQHAEAVLQDLRLAEEKAVISVMAGVPLDALRRLVAPARNIARAIPLPSVAVRASVTPIHPATPEAKALFGLLGTAIDVPDAHAFEAIFASTATFAAHFAYLGAISLWLVTMGIPEDVARRHVASMFAGLADSLRGHKPDFGHLAREYATQGGINEQFLGHVRGAGMFEAVDAGLRQIFGRLTAASSAPPQR